MMKIILFDGGITLALALLSLSRLINCRRPLITRLDCWLIIISLSLSLFLLTFGAVVGRSAASVIVLFFAREFFVYSR